MSAERDTAGNVHWLETRFNELLANHERECVARITALEASSKTAGEQVMKLTQDNEAVRLELSQALAERDQESENAARIAEELSDAKQRVDTLTAELRQARAAALTEAANAAHAVASEQEEDKAFQGAYAAAERIEALLGDK